MLEGIISAIITLVIVVGILLLTYIATRYIAGISGASKATRNISIVEKVSVGQDKSVAIAKVGDKYLLLGITAGGITTLCELLEDELTFADVTPQAPYDFKAVFDKFLKRSDGKEKDSLDE